MPTPSSFLIFERPFLSRYDEDHSPGQGEASDLFDPSKEEDRLALALRHSYEHPRGFKRGQLGKSILIDPSNDLFFDKVRVTLEALRDPGVHATIRPAIYYKDPENSNDPGMGIRPGALVKRASGSLTLVHFRGIHSLHRAKKKMDAQGQLIRIQELKTHHVQDLTLMVYLGIKTGLPITKAGIVHLSAKQVFDSKAVDPARLFEFVAFLDEEQNFVDDYFARIRNAIPLEIARRKRCQKKVPGTFSRQVLLAVQSLDNKESVAIFFKGAIC